MIPTEAQIETFRRDGVVKVERAVDEHWIDALTADAERELAAPGEWLSDTNPGATVDRLFTSRYRWQHEPVIDSFIHTSGVAELAARLMGSDSARFYFDHLLVKEPQTTAPTPWHQDLPYWPFLGRQIGSVWVALTSATVTGSSLEFVRASHDWNKVFIPTAFAGQSDWLDDFAGGEPCPDIEAARDDYDIVGFEVEPGDALVFSAWTVHGSPGNAEDSRRVAFSTRWLGDDTVWQPHPGCDPTVDPATVSVAPGAYPADDARFPLVWSAA
ncbi:MAG: phytanoyl-CoA dioxygenase family protein [Actinomycetota bacterium]